MSQSYSTVSAFPGFPAVSVLSVLSVLSVFRHLPRLQISRWSFPSEQSPVKSHQLTLEAVEWAATWEL